MIERSEGTNLSPKKVITRINADGQTEIGVSVNEVAEFWLKIAADAAIKHEIKNRLGLKNDSGESLLSKIFLGVRLIRQYQGRERDLIREAELQKDGYTDERWFHINQAERGINNLGEAADALCEEYKISTNRKNMIDLAINALTSQYFFNVKQDSRSEVKFNPSNSMLKRWEQQWGPKCSEV